MTGKRKTINGWNILKIGILLTSKIYLLTSHARKNITKYDATVVYAPATYPYFFRKIEFNIIFNIPDTNKINDEK